MANSLQDLIVRVGVEGIPAFKGAFKDAIEALETTGARAVGAGNAIQKAFANLGVSDASSKVALEAKKLQQSFGLLEKSFKEGKISAADFAKAQEGIATSLRKLGDTAEPLAAKLAKVSDAFKTIGVSGTGFQINSQIDKLKTSLADLEHAQKEGTISAKDYAAAQDAVNREINELTGNIPSVIKQTASLSDRLGSIAAGAKSLGSTLTLSVTAPIVGLAGASIKAAADMEALEIGLRAVTKETGPLSAQLERLKEVAKLPGLGFKEAVQGSINLQAAGFSAGTAERALKAFGNALATVGKGRVELDGVILALTQIASKTKVGAQEINQLSERLPQIREAIKGAFGEGFNDAADFEKAGIAPKVFIDKIIKEFEKLPKAVGGFKNDMENLRDSAEQTLASFGKALLPFASSALKAFQPVIDGLQSLALEFAKLPQPVQTAIVGVTALAAATGPVVYAFGSMASGVQALLPLLAKLGTSGGGIAGLTGSLSGLGGALAAIGPAAAIAAAAVAVGFGLYSLKPQAEELIEVLKAVGAEYKDFTALLKSGSEATSQPIIDLGDRAADAAKLVAELSPAFVAARAALVAYREDAASTSPIFGDVGKAFEEMKKRFVWTDFVTGYGLATTAAREFANTTITAIKNVTGVYPEMAAAAEKNLARVQAANQAAMRGPIAQVGAVQSGVAAIKTEAAANLEELATAQKVLKTLKEMKASKEELAAATIRVTNAQRKLHPELTATGNAAGGAASGVDELKTALANLSKVDEFSSKLKKLNDDMQIVDKAFRAGKVSQDAYDEALNNYFEGRQELVKKVIDNFEKVDDAAKKAATALNQTFAKAAQDLLAKYKNDLKPIEITLSLKDRVGPELFAKIEEAQKHAKDLATAFKVAGVAQASLLDQADDMWKAYEKIAASVGKIGGATEGQALNARARALEAEIKAQRELNGNVQEYQEQLTILLGKINEIKSADDAYRNAGLETLKELQVEAERAAKAYEIIGKTGMDSAVRILTAQQKALEAQREVAIATGAQWAIIDDQLERVAERLKRATDLKGLTDLQAAFRNFTTDAGAAITTGFNNAFDSLIKGDFRGIGKAFTSMWRDVAAAALKDFVQPLTNALATFFGHTIRDLLKGSLSGIKEDVKDLVSVVKGLFGAGSNAASTAAKAGATGASAVGSASDLGAATTGIAGSAGNAGSAAASSAGGLAGAVNLISGAVSAVSAVIGNFQFYAMNKSLDIIVKHTLQTANDLANLRADEWTREGHLFAKLDDLAKFTWVKLDEIISSVRALELIGGGTTGESVSIPGFEALLEAVRESGASIVAAIKAMGTVAETSAVKTETIVLRNAEEMSQFLAKLVQDQAAAFSGLPVELQQAIDAGKLSELVAGQDEATQKAIAEYVRISKELEQVREAVNSLKPAVAATAQASQSAAADLSQIQAVITPTQGGFDTSAVLAGLAAFSDRMAGYWEKLFETFKGTVTADAKAVTEATKEAGAVVKQAVETGTVSTDTTTAAVNFTRTAIERAGANIAEQTEVLKSFPGFTRTPINFPTATAPATDYLANLPGFTAAAYGPTISDSAVRPTAFSVPSLAQFPTLASSLLPSPPTLYPPNSDEWKLNQMAWQNTTAPQIADWKPATMGGSSAPACVCSGHPMPPQLPIQVHIDGHKVADAMATYYEQLGYR